MSSQETKQSDLPKTPTGEAQRWQRASAGYCVWACWECGARGEGAADELEQHKATHPKVPFAIAAGIRRVQYWLGRLESKLRGVKRLS